MLTEVMWFKMGAAWTLHRHKQAIMARTRGSTDQVLFGYKEYRR